MNNTKSKKEELIERIMNLTEEQLKAWLSNPEVKAILSEVSQRKKTAAI